MSNIYNKKLSQSINHYIMVDLPNYKILYQLLPINKYFLSKILLFFLKLTK